MEYEKPLITVGIFTYNKFDYLQQTINSVFIQDYPNIEIILSDDASSNYDLNYIKKITSNAPSNIKNLQIIHNEKNIGTVKSLNNCIRSSNGDFIIGLGSDDVFYETTTISKIVDFFLQNNALIVTAKRLVYDQNMKKKIAVLPTDSDIRYLLEAQDFLFERLCISNFISGACTYYSKKLFDKYGLFDEDYILLEDYPLYLRLARRNETIHFFNEITVKYRLGGISTSGEVNPLLQRDFLYAIKKEILPFNNRINNNLYRWKSFEYEFNINHRKLSYRLIKEYPEVVFLKSLVKLKLINNTERLIYNQRNTS